MGQSQPWGLRVSLWSEKNPVPHCAEPRDRARVPRSRHAPQVLEDAQNKRLLSPSLPGRKFLQIFFLSLLSETRDGAVNMLQMQNTATRVLGTKEFAPSVMALGRRGVWEDRLSLQEQLCTISHKGRP